jgi:hypothetical protein
VVSCNTRLLLEKVPYGHRFLLPEEQLLLDGTLAFLNTVKPAHAVTSVKQPPVLKGDIFLFLSWKIS